MLGMHGTYEANLVMHGCDVMLNVGARFDDRVTGKLTAFSPRSKKIHVDIDPSSINKNVPVDVPVVGGCRARAGGADRGVGGEPGAAGPRRTGRVVAADRRLARQGFSAVTGSPATRAL